MTTSRPSSVRSTPSCGRLTRLRRFAGWVGRDPIAIGELASSVFEYLNLLFLLDANALYFGDRELHAHGASLLRVIAVVGDVDAAVSVASLRAGTQFWTRPAFLPPAAPTELAGIRHPLVEDAVPNSIVLGPPYGVLITGSNMSGKSTFVRTVGVNVILAQTIHTCFASSYESPVLRVRSCIGRTDDLLAGKSYYLVEVESVLSLVRASADPAPCLFLLDELFRGTNAVERIAAADAVLSELVGSEPGGRLHRVITATHDGELVDLLRDTYAPFHLTDSLGADGLVFEDPSEARPGDDAERHRTSEAERCAGRRRQSCAAACGAARRAAHARAGARGDRGIRRRGRVIDASSADRKILLNSRAFELLFKTSRWMPDCASWCPSNRRSEDQKFRSFLD